MLIYLIDDDIVSLFLTEQVLRLGSFRDQVIPFMVAEEALAYLLPRLETDSPQVIFLDLNMPVMDGWQFLDALTPYAQVLAGRCRIYLLTSSLALADTTRANNHALISGIIHKPLGEDEVKVILMEEADLLKGTLSLPTARVNRLAPFV